MSTAMVTRGICISERIPSCIRAPPDADEQNEGAPFTDGGLHRLYQRFANAHAKRTAQKIEGLHRDHHGHSVERAARGNKGFLAARLGAGILQPSM